MQSARWMAKEAPTHGAGFPSSKASLTCVAAFGAYFLIFDVVHTLTLRYSHHPIHLYRPNTSRPQNTIPPHPPRNTAQH